MTASLGERPALLFDLDGTLVDSGDDLAASLNHVLRQDSLPALGRARVLAMLGDGAPVLVARAYAYHGSEPPADALARFRAHYRRHCLDATRPYPGIEKLLRRLAAGRAIAVATNKPTAFAERVVEGLGLARYLNAVVGPEVAGGKKPAPELPLAALAALGHRPEDAVMIGDSPADVEAGRRAGTATVAVLWGYRSREQLVASAPDRLAASVGELGEILDGTSGARRP